MYKYFYTTELFSSLTFSNPIVKQGGVNGTCWKIKGKTIKQIHLTGLQAEVDPMALDSQKYKTVFKNFVFIFGSTSVAPYHFSVQNYIEKTFAQLINFVLDLRIGSMYCPFSGV